MTLGAHGWSRHAAGPIWVAGATLVLAIVFLMGAPLGQYGRPSRSSAAQGAADVFHGVNQQALARCVARHQNCAVTVPGLARCMRCYRVCNQAAARRTAGSGANLDRPVSAGTPLLSKAAAEKGWAAQGTITEAILTTYGAAHHALPALAASVIINPTRPVWVITVHFRHPGLLQGPVPSGAPPEYVDWARAVVDATTGTMTDEGLSGTAPPPLPAAIANDEVTVLAMPTGMSPRNNRMGTASIRAAASLVWRQGEPWRTIRHRGMAECPRETAGRELSSG